MADTAAQTMLNNIPEKTGKTLKQWHAVLKRSALAKHGELVKLLKSEHAVTHGFANLIVHEYRHSGGSSGGGEGASDPVKAQYSGAKADLQPIYEALIKTVKAFGKDVEVAPKKAYVSLRRNKQFAMIQPSTKTRVDVGINLKGSDCTDRLEASGSFNSMVTHRVRLSEASDVDDELVGWLKEAYKRA